MSTPAQSRGIVCVLGWMMCKPRHLQKIAGWWTQRGFTPLQVEGDPKVLFFPNGTGRQKGADIAQKLTKLDAEINNTGTNPPIFFHVFSGQGGATLVHTLRGMSPVYKKRVAGIVMDCVPAKMDIDQATLGLKSAFYSNPWIGEVVGPPFWLFGKGLDLVNPGLQRWGREYNEIMMASVPRWQVFHSKADPYVPHEYLTELVEQKRGAGGSVNYKLWEKGEHVGLFREYNEEYSALLNTFVERAEEEYSREHAPNTEACEADVVAEQVPASA